mmetsp:Transcript_15463/g.47850  ORF Transcript_15463/g.47850 Transcript_15463/m.47850 type:complete len:235 (-) Transcript_15463:4107-4811(-)
MDSNLSCSYSGVMALGSVMRKRCHSARLTVVLASCATFPAAFASGCVERLSASSEMSSAPGAFASSSPVASTKCTLLSARRGGAPSADACVVGGVSLGTDSTSRPSGLRGPVCGRESSAALSSSPLAGLYAPSASPSMDSSSLLPSAAPDGPSSGLPSPSWSRCCRWRSRSADASFAASRRSSSSSALTSCAPASMAARWSSAAFRAARQSATMRRAFPPMAASGAKMSVDSSV